MKRLLFVLAIILAIPRLSSAQKLTFDDTNRTILEALTSVAECVGSPKVILDEGALVLATQKIEAPFVITDCKTGGEGKAVIEKLVPSGYTVYLDLDLNMHVRPTTTPSPKAAPSTIPAALAQLANQPAAALSPENYTYGDDYRAISEHVHRVMLGDRAYEQAEADNTRTPSIWSAPGYRTTGLAVPYPGGGIPAAVPSYSYGYESYSDYGIGGHEYVQRQIDRSTWGALRFKKGREGVMENVEVWGCGKRLTQADEGNNIWDDVVLVPVDCSPLTFRYTDGAGKDWEVEIAEQIVPLRLQSSKKITLDEKFFQRARIRTEMLQYNMVEQPDGSFKKVQRTQPTVKK